MGWAIFIIPICLFFTACQPTENDTVDELNRQAYEARYRNLETTHKLAQKAWKEAANYADGRAEAENNLAFVDIARMNYAKAQKRLNEVERLTDNEVELLVADVQLMRLCQRQSKNKDFYFYSERAKKRIRRIEEERNRLNVHQLHRFTYATSEHAIVTSTYYYYVGLLRPSIQALHEIHPDGELQKDTAQLLAYWYNLGTGGIAINGTAVQNNQMEFEYLMRCLFLSVQGNYPYWTANSMQAISEKLQNTKSRKRLMADNKPAMDYINAAHVTDTLLAGNLADRALKMFQSYGDPYQTAGAYRTLAGCYRTIGDNKSALICLTNALNQDKRIWQAPDLVASISEQLSIVYAAMNDKKRSDENRNVYIDLQEQTRQDRYLESRADQLNSTSEQQNLMIAAVLGMIILTALLIWTFDRMRIRSERKQSVDFLLEPLEEWERRQDILRKEALETYEEVEEQTAMMNAALATNKLWNLELRAKLEMVHSILPFIDRILNETNSLCTKEETPQVRHERYNYIGELVNKINDYNARLTAWIQMRRGDLSVRIESFPLQNLFDILRKSKTGFEQKGVAFNVEDTTTVVKADRTLTLFMLNTIADNARKFTSQGDKVSIRAIEHSNCVDIEIADTGKGMSNEELKRLFDVKPLMDEATISNERSHGFGLMNCKGIIEKYKKLSKIFEVCRLHAESQEGIGSTFTITLPKGLAKRMWTLLLLSLPFSAIAGTRTNSLSVAQGLHRVRAYADSAYFSNINGQYERTLLFADSCLKVVNTIAAQRNMADSLCLYESTGTLPTELDWQLTDTLMPYLVIRDLRNEIAVAALALHRWNLYHYNNNLYTMQFRRLSADPTLSSYVKTMQQSETNKNVAVTLLILLFLLLFPAYYFLYYRHRLSYRFCLNSVNKINQILLSNISDEEKHKEITRIIKTQFTIDTGHNDVQKLYRVVGTVKQALEKCMADKSKQNMLIEQIREELKRTQYEKDLFHVCNNVLENCLSMLKHETMYYPSRIKVLMDTTPTDTKAMRDVVNYYQELSMLLYTQCVKQLDKVHLTVSSTSLSTFGHHMEREYFADDPLSDEFVDDTRIKLVGDPQLINHLFFLLYQQNRKERPRVSLRKKQGNYIILIFNMNNLSTDETTGKQLFTPLTIDTQFLLCRQIVREIGESTNARGCGIAARPEEGGTRIEVTLLYRTAPRGEVKNEEPSYGKI